MSSGFSLIVAAMAQAVGGRDGATRLICVAFYDGAMGGDLRRASSTMLVAAILVLSDVSVASASMEAWDCRAGQQIPPDPPYDALALVIDLEWEHADKHRMTFRAPNPGGPVPGDGTISRAGGCLEGARIACWDAAPLIFTEAQLPGPWSEWRAGRYVITAEVMEPCQYSDAIGELDAARLDAVYSLGAVEVTATVKQCEANGPCEEVTTLSGMVPVPPKGTVYAGNLAPEEFRLALATFDWDPATGIGNLEAATPEAATGQALSGDTEVDTGGSALDELGGPEAPDGPAEAIAPDAATGPSLDPLQRLAAWLVHVGVWVDPARSLGEGSDAERAVDAVLLLRALIVLAMRTALDQGEDTTDLAAAYHALGLVGLLLEDDADATDTIALPKRDVDPTAEASEPRKDPPKMKGAAMKQKRVWVWLPAPAVVYQTYPTVEKKTLKAGTWYQMKDNADDSRNFYNRKGKWIGTSPPKERDQVEVRRKGEEKPPE